MAQPELAELIKEKMLTLLPEEGLNQLLAIPEDGKDHEAEVKKIFDAYNIDPTRIAQQLREEGYEF